MLPIINGSAWTNILCIQAIHLHFAGTVYLRIYIIPLIPIVDYTDTLQQNT